MGETREPDGWGEHRREQIRAQLRSTPAQRLAWLEEAIELARRAGAYRRTPRPAEDPGIRSWDSD